jgi:hypothetical protein
VKVIKAALILHKQYYQHTTGHANSQAAYVYKRNGFMLQ